MALEKKYNVQVDKTHYEKDTYDNEERFISYFTQKEVILNIAQKIPGASVLEIGKGTGFLEMYLKSKGVHVKTFDFAEDLHPDYLGDVRSIGETVPEKFDIVAAFEILEHIPFEDLDKALEGIKSVSRKYVVISLPQFRLHFFSRFKISLFKPLYFGFYIPLPLKHDFTGEHYWELGKRNFSPKRFRNKLKEHFVVKKEFTHPLNIYHRFYVLEKKS